MKIAIIGSSPIALEAALSYDQHGATLTWFRDDDVVCFKKTHFRPTDFTSEIGHKNLNSHGLVYESPQFFSWSHWKNFYEAPLVDILMQNHIIKVNPVLSVSKRFLAIDEQIANHSRFYDLFRVIYQVDPHEILEAQKKLNPEVFDKLSEDIKNPLGESLEMYEDFDLVLDFRTDQNPSSISASGRALGEKKISGCEQILYGADLLKRIDVGENLDFLKEKELKVKELKAKEVAIIGSGALASEVLLELGHYLNNSEAYIYLITHEDNPFEEYFTRGNKQTIELLNDFFQDHENKYQHEKDNFLKAQRDWQNLDDFVKVKVPRPEVPTPKLNFFSSHNVTSLDRLQDQKKIFLTLETPSFRNPKRHLENNQRELKTIGVDLVIVCHSKKDEILHFSKSELGYFELIPEKQNYEKCWDQDLFKLKVIENEIFKLFSSNSEHPTK